MSNEYLKSLIDTVSAIEVKSEVQQIAKYELIEYVEELKEKINKISKKELKVRNMLYSIENGILTRERLIQIEEVLFEVE